MGNKTLLFIGMGVLLLIGVCLLGYGLMSVVGSTSATGRESWLTFGLIFSCVGALFLGGGVWVAVIASKTPAASVSQNVTYKVDLPAQTKIEQMTCRNCGGALKADNIKMLAGAPTVECPFCGTTYQLTEEPKW
ncbi:MAG: hypothetical protein Fur002_17030 [Anaerolineales bacterium]